MNCGGDIIFTKFLSVDEKKQRRIINAAIKEFSIKGFKNASTNEIVKAAEISKGLLFHYFKNKKELFLYLYDYFMKKSIDDFYNKIDLGERDIIKRLYQIGIIKLEMSKEYLEMFKFLQRAYYEKDNEVSIEINEKNLELSGSNYLRIFEDIDSSKFKEGIDIQKAMNVIIWAFEGLGNVEMEKAKKTGTEIDIERVLKYTDEYINMFKMCFYK